MNVAKRVKPNGAIISSENLKRLEAKENQGRLKRVRALKTTEEYIPFERFVLEYEEKWGVNLELNHVGE